jgi:hypothetical protein
LNFKKNVFVDRGFKVHPDTDALLAAIALADPKVILLVLAGKEPASNVEPRYEDSSSSDFRAPS